MTGMLTLSILLFAADILLAVAMTYKVDFLSCVRDLSVRKHRGPEGTGFLASNLGNNSATVLKPLQRFDLIYIEKSNIRHYIPFFNVYMLLAVMAFVFIIVFQPVTGLLDFFPTALVISLLISLLPLFALDLLARYNSETIRKKLSEYVSVLNRWCSVKEDIMYAFEKSLSSGIGEPLQTFIRDMVIQVNRGMNPEEAFDILQMKVDNPQFRDFILNIKLSLRHRGDIRKLLANLENQFYRIDEEYNRRRVSTYKDRMLIYFVMAAVLAAVFVFIRFSEQVGEFYLHTAEGKMLLMVFSGMYALGFYLTSGIMRFKG
ncbi:MAG TPA: type II secretion system F family protein [Clostridia bacterium]|nr:type II secretion system F family protein [Clostridia bacterium]